MANLIEDGSYPSGIYQIEIGDKVKGGEGGTANLQPQQLANRTAFLKAAIEAILDGTTSAGDADKLDGMNTGQSGVSFIPYADSSGNVGIGVVPTAKLHVSAGDTSSIIIDGDTVYKSAILTATAGGRSVGIGSSAGGQANYIGSLDSGHPIKLFIYNDSAGVFQTALAIGNDGVTSIQRSDGATLAQIVENGSNANGEYTKFADGTMICLSGQKQATGVNINIAANGGYRSSGPDQVLPATFINSDYSVIATVNAANIAESACDPTSGSGFTFGFSGITSQTGLTLDYSWIAIGRWY